MTTYLDEIDINGELYRVEVEFEFSPVIPARTSGDPSLCHPEEGGDLLLHAVTDDDTGEDLGIEGMEAVADHADTLWELWQ